MCFTDSSFGGPPHCDDADLPGWDWSQHEGAYTESEGVRSGTFVLTGSFDGDSFTATDVQPPVRTEHTFDFTIPCPEPAGGWQVLDPSRTTNETALEVGNVADGLPGFAMRVVSRTDGSPAPGSPEETVVTVHVTEDPAGAERKLREVWGGMLCVAEVAHSQAELTRVQQELIGLPGLLSVSAGSLDNRGGAHGLPRRRSLPAVGGPGSTAKARSRSPRSCNRSTETASLTRMAAAKPVMVRAGDREVRVSSPDRVIYEATDMTPEVTKVMVAEYFTSVQEGLMRALRNRPTALERWTSGVRPGMKLATGPFDKDADAFYQKRVPKGAPDYLESVEITFPSGRTAEEICPTEIAVPVWCAHMGTLTFPPGPSVATLRPILGRTTPTSSASTSTPSRGPTSPTRSAWPASRASCWPTSA
ncbi:non-homologous end-joining DNA ligase LigD [Nocardioides sp. B-3]|uniref:non-homologous end-joining DNA ligase LigD n=1 Tax=Nocardioides sp. B-3 TaxID=2895565 RepID=UPI00300E5850